MPKKKSVVSKKSVKSAVVSTKKAADSPEKHPEKPVITPEKTADKMPPGHIEAVPKEPSLFERKVELLRVQFGKSEKMHSEKQINAALNLRIIELLEEIRDGLKQFNGG